jgi:hypothetical protein
MMVQRKILLLLFICLLFNSEEYIDEFLLDYSTSHPRRVYSKNYLLSKRRCSCHINHFSAAFKEWLVVWNTSLIILKEIWWLGRKNIVTIAVHMQNCTVTVNTQPLDRHSLSCLVLNIHVHQHDKCASQQKLGCQCNLKSCIGTWNIVCLHMYDVSFVSSLTRQEE